MHGQKTKSRKIESVTQSERQRERERELEGQREQ